MAAAKLRRRELEVVFFPRLDDHRLRAGQLDQFGIADPIGRRDDHFVARIAERREHIVQRMLGAVGNDDLLGQRTSARAASRRRWPRPASVRECRWPPCNACGRLAWRPTAASQICCGRGEVGLADAEVVDLLPGASTPWPWRPSPAWRKAQALEECGRWWGAFRLAGMETSVAGSDEDGIGSASCDSIIDCKDDDREFGSRRMSVRLTLRAGRLAIERLDGNSGMDNHSFSRVRIQGSARDTRRPH